LNFPYIQNNFNPASKPDTILSATVDDFSGGINNRVTPILLKPNEALDLYNIKLSNQAEKRTGTEAYDTLITDGEIVYMDVYKPINLPEVLIRATATSVYAGETKIKTVTGKIQGTNYVGNYYFVDGSKFYQYDGTNVYEIVAPPEQHLNGAVSAAATTIIIDEWDDRIVIGTKGQIESATGIDKFTVATINKATKTFTITAGLAYAHVDESFIRLYQPLDNTHYQGVYGINETLKLKWYEPCDFELDDDYKGEHLLPNNCSCCTIDSERIYISGCLDNPNEIYISDINNPFYFPVTLGVQCPPDGDKVIDLIPFDDAIVAGRSKDVHVIYGTTNNLDLSDQFEIRKFDTHTGFSSINNARLVNNYMFYMGSDMNVYGMTTIMNNNNVLATTIINKDKIDFTKKPFEFTLDDIANCPAIYYKDEYYIIIDDIVVVYNYINRNWTKYHDLNASFFLIKDNELIAGTNDGLTIKFTDTYNDSGKAIKCYYKTGQMNLNNPINFKNFQDMFAITHTWDNYESSITLNALIDYNEIVSSTDIFSLISRFGVTTFGERLVSSNIVQTDYIPINLRGRVISYVFSNNELDEPMKVYQIACTYIPRGTR